MIYGRFKCKTVTRSFSIRMHKVWLFNRLLLLLCLFRSEMRRCFSYKVWIADNFYLNYCFKKSFWKIILKNLFKKSFWITYIYLNILLYVHIQRDKYIHINFALIIYFINVEFIETSKYFIIYPIVSPVNTLLYILNYFDREKKREFVWR